MKYGFGGYILDTDRFELSLGDTSLAVEPQALELLVLLIENRHRMVEKDEIYSQIWAGKVVSDSALSSRIKMIRQVLGDSGREQRFIKTVHGKGFRFVAILDGGDVSVSPSSVQVVATSRDKPTIMVLPCLNLSADTSQEYFADAVCSDIIAWLSKHRWLKVIARNTSFGFKHKTVDYAELARTFGVDYVVEGSVQKSGNRIRISAQLTDIRSSSHLWAERFDAELVDIFDVQDEITEKIVARLEPVIGFSERQRVSRTRELDFHAWDYFHLGVYHFFKFTADDNKTAQQFLKKSTELDTHFGDAQAWWAYSVIIGMVYWDTPAETNLMSQALAACNRALELDNHNATFYALRARVQLARCEYDAAIIDNERAIGLNPTFAAAHCGLGDSLAYDARYDEAIQCFDRAIALSPNDPQVWAFLSYGALAHIFMKDYNAALTWSERALGIPNCQYWALSHKVVALSYLGRCHDATLSLSKLLDITPHFSLQFAKDKLFYLSREEQKELYIGGLSNAGLH